MVGGTPCTDFSNAGNKKGLSGKTALPTYAWLSLALKSNVAIHENVPGFPSLLEAVAGPAGKHVAVLPVEPAHCGFGQIASRKRRYRCMRDANVQLLADEPEVYRQLQTVMPNDCTLEDILESSSLADVKEELGSNANKKIRAALPCFQRKTLAKYEEFMSSSERQWQISHLGDNPAKRPCRRSRKSGALPALRHSMSALWVHRFQRPMLRKELLTSMGWRPPHALHGSASQYRRWLGNGMHLANVFTVVLLTLACTPASCTAIAGRPAPGESQLITAFQEYIRPRSDAADADCQTLIDLFESYKSQQSPSKSKSKMACVNERVGAAGGSEPWLFEDCRVLPAFSLILR